MDNVIEKQDIEKHTIQKYRFKVLGSSVQNEDESCEDRAEIDKKEILELPESKEEFVQQDENKFVEELLKKSDELSSNIIKMQMQIEKQESDFHNRLETEIAREKETSLKEGYEKAKQELEQKYDLAMQSYKNSAQKLNDKLNTIDDFLSKIEKDIANTAVEVAKEVVKKEISSDSSDVAIALAKELLNELRDANKITIKVHPDDFKMMSEVFGDNKKVKVEVDTAISKGGVVLLSENGNLDGNISERFEKVKNLLHDN